VASDPHRVFTKGELLRDVWNYRSLGSKAPFYAWEAPWKRAIDAALTEFQYRSLRAWSLRSPAPGHVDRVSSGKR
jgi:hypothetical protein